MTLYFHAKLYDLRMTALEFFEVAYAWHFGKTTMDLSTDICQFTLHGILPKYVTNYLLHLQKGEQDATVHSV